jgi:plasmid maintenance system antidote protein VapI
VIVDYNLQASYDLKIAMRESDAKIRKEVEPRAA